MSIVSNLIITLLTGLLRFAKIKSIMFVMNG